MADNRVIGLREVRSLQPGQIIWDSKVTGFGARRQKGTKVSYIIAYRTKDNRQRWYTIGKHGSPWTPDTARSEALRILGDVVGGTDPSQEKISNRKASSVSELCDLYLADAEAGRLLTRRRTTKKESTLLTDKGRIERHIKPLLGQHKVAAVTREDIEAFMHDVAEGKTAGRSKTEKSRGLANVRGGRGTASRTVGLLGAIFGYAVRKRLRLDNPVRGVMRFADGKRLRRVSDEEYAALGAGLRTATDIWPPAIAATRMLALTGWRRGEVLGLTWADLDIPRRTATLGDTKTGRSIRPLSLAVCELLRAQARSGEYVFAASRGNGLMTGYPKIWMRISKIAGLPGDITPHVLRHSFASLAGDLGYTEATIASMVGHKGQSITSKYVHASDAVLLAAADKVANMTLELMGDRAADAVVVPMTRSGSTKSA
jgi:integrase